MTAKAHGGLIEIFGITVATVDDQVRLQKIDTWFDPLSMFRQIDPDGVVTKDTTSEVADGSCPVAHSGGESQGFFQLF